MNRADFQKLANDRIADAKVLLAGKRWAAAYYLAGYGVECGLKSCVIAYLMRTDQFPEKRFSEQCWTHSLKQLLELGGLRADLDAAGLADPDLLANWDIVKDWSESSRYVRTTNVKAEELYDAITDKKHGGALMDQSTLVEMQIDDGQRLIHRLAEEGVEVTAAAWVKESESGQWFLYVATPLVGEDGATRPAYRRMNAVVRQLHKEGFWIDPLEIKLIGPAEPVAKILVAVRDHYRGRTPTRFRGDRLGDLATEEAYIYAPALGRRV